MAENPDIRKRNDAIAILQERQQENEMFGNTFNLNGIIQESNE